MTTTYDYNQTTAYSILDKDGQKSTITIRKIFSDGIVKIHGVHVHAWVQRTYDRIVKDNTNQNKKMSRLEIGNEVRTLASVEASKVIKWLFL